MFVTIILAITLALQGTTSGRIKDQSILQWKEWLYSRPSNSSTQKTTTEAITVKPCQESLYVKKDIEAIVNYMYDQLRLNETIENSYKQFAKDVHVAKMTKLDQFERWFTGQPEQLKDIIKDIAENRKMIEPQVYKIGKLLEDRKNIEVKIQQQQEQYNAYKKVYATYKSICDVNCGHKVIKRSVDNKLYCGTAEEIKNRSTSEMEKQVKDLMPELIKTIKNYNETYENEIEHLKNKIKDIALKYYGPIMYETLLLQEEYHTYKNLVSKESESKMYDVKKTVTMIDADLIQMEPALDRYKSNCLYCTDNSNTIINLMTSYASNDDAVFQLEIESLLDRVIHSKIDKIHRVALNDITYFFQDLDKKIQDVQKRETEVKNFEPIKQEIQNELAKERESFNKLKTIAPIEDVVGFTSLQGHVILLQTNIYDLLKKVNN